jgi:ferrous iron transport protein A
VKNPIAQKRSKLLILRKKAAYFKIRKQKQTNKTSFAVNKGMIVRLSELKPGQQGIIREFNDNHIFLKLMEMGCVPGEKIVLEQIAPLGDPISVSVAGYRLSLRLNEAEHIFVELNN